jgi:D-arabinose 1-dehydrogenase-like Zn-dependent alcohol dehydrogenase
MDMIVSEKMVVGNLVGNYPDLVELRALADRGLIKLTSKEYLLNGANATLHDSGEGTIQRTRGAVTVSICPNRFPDLCIPSYSQLE